MLGDSSCKIAWALTLASLGLFWLVGDVASAAVRGGTPLSCDGQPADRHAERVKAILRHAYDERRILDSTPAKRSEKAAWREHKRCVLDVERRERLGRYAEHQRRDFERTFLQYIEPPGPRWLAVTRRCETGSSGSYEEQNGSTYDGAYQFDVRSWRKTRQPFERITGINATRSRAAPRREQDIRAAIWWRIAGSRAWPNCAAWKTA